MDMKHPDSKNGYLEELKEFLAFSKNLWAILTSISIFFPFSNILINAIPLRAYGTDDGVFDQLSPYLITAIATVVTLFVVLGAAGILLRRIMRFLNPTQSGCGGGCTGCEPPVSPSMGGTLVSLSLPPQSIDHMSDD